MLKRHLEKNVVYFILIGIGIILFVLPYISIGIMHNDELIARYWSFNGFFQFYLKSFHDFLSKGRAISSITTPVFQYLGFITSNMYVCRVIQISIIILNIISFGTLIGMLFGDKKFAGYLIIVLALFLPLSFEPTLPNAYVTLYGIPLTFLIISLILYVDYIRKGSKIAVLLSMILLLVSCCSYEAFVTFVPVYLIIVWKEKIKKFTDIKASIRFFSIPIMCGILFLLAYGLCGIAFPSNYAGIQIDFSIKSAATIIFELFKRSFPGGLACSTKYQYLFEYYKDYLSLDGKIRILCVFIIAIVCVWKLIFSYEEGKKNSVRNIIFSTLIILFCSVLPSIPISIAGMYQGNIGNHGFVALPVTYFAYYTSTLGVTYIIWESTKFIKNKKVQMVVLIIFLMGAAHIQVENEVFSKQMNKSFERLKNVESLFMTETIDSFSHICSLDVFEVRNTLAIHDSYWSDFSSLKGKTVIVEKGTYEETDADYSLYATDDETFAFVEKKREKVYVFCKKRCQKQRAITVGKGEYISLDVTDECYKDNNYYIYEITDCKS